MKTLDLDKPSENIDYKLVPTVVDGKDAWNVDLLRSPFGDVTIRFEVLGDILDAAIDTGSLYKKDTHDGHQPTADDSTESTD